VTCATSSIVRIVKTLLTLSAAVVANAVDAALARKKFVHAVNGSV
jgi:hypothetical protein